MKPAHRGLGNSHGKENKALIGAVSLVAQDEQPFAGLRKVAFKQWLKYWRAERKQRIANANALRRAENEAELARINERLRHASE
jgi:hypothetical protein